MVIGFLFLFQKIRRRRRKGKGLYFYEKGLDPYQYMELHGATTKWRKLK